MSSLVYSSPVEIHTCIGCEGLTSGGVYVEIGIITWVAAYKLSPSVSVAVTYEHTDQRTLLEHTKCNERESLE